MRVISFKRIGVAAASILVVSCMHHARQDRRPAHLDPLVNELLMHSGVPSVSVARIEHGKLSWSKAWGEQSPGVPATAETLYNVASLTKPISAETVLRLSASGRLSLDEPMSRYWIDPDLADDARHNLLTPRIALSHRTGFANWRTETGGRLKFNGQPGEKIGYSGEGFEYLARFTERRVGMPFERLAEQYVLQPSDMKRTAYTHRDWFIAHVASPTDANGRVLSPTRRYSFVASDDVHTTATDYARFLTGVSKGEGLNPEATKAREEVRASLRDRLCSGAKALSCPDEAGHGLGWDVAVFGDERVLWHTGADQGEFAFAYVIPRTGEGMVILTNSAVGFKVVLPILEAAGANQRFLAFLRPQAS